MIASTDYVGIGALVGAIAAAVVSVIVAWRQSAVKATTQDIQHQVTTPNGGTIGEIIAANDLTGATPRSTPKVEP